MKKVILALAIVSVTFAACNGGETKETPAVDSPKVEAAPVETPAPAATDTAAAAAPVADTTKK